MLTRKLLISFLLFCLCGAAYAEDAKAVLAASAGTWEGELYYLDYQSGQRFAIPMRVEAFVTPDGATLVSRLVFTDPGTLVHAVNVATIDRDSGELVESYFREGRAEMSRATIVTTEFAGDSEWRMVYELDGSDGDRPARIRHTIARNGNSLTSKKEVRLLDGDETYFERNGSELTLVTPGK